MHDERTLDNLSQQIALVHLNPGLYRAIESPFLLHIERRQLYAFFDIASACLGNPHQRSLYAVIDVCDKSRPQENGKRPAV